MENKEVLKLLKLLASLLELHQDPGNTGDTFKIRGYNNAIFNLERLDQPLARLSFDAICKLEGVGKSIASVIFELINTGRSAALDELIQKTPPGIIEMLNLKGIGPKKIRVIWEELKIETIADLLQACEDGMVRKLKGFGEKTEESIKQGLLFTASNKNKMHYATAEKVAHDLEKVLKLTFPEAIISTSGTLRRRLEIIEEIDFVIGFDNAIAVHEGLETIDLLQQDLKSSGPFCWRGSLADGSMKVNIYISSRKNFYNQLLLHTGSESHLAYQLPNQQTLLQLIKEETLGNEEALYEKAGIPYIIPELREGMFEFNPPLYDNLPHILEKEDLKGVIHCHSTYSDGKNTLREMAEACLKAGYEYMGITDHSISAFYANGLDGFRIVQQQKEADKLNESLAPFRIFKGIESDILNDGSLDYPDEILSSFDFVIASVHSNLKMDITKATDRLVKAIANPFTTFLGHATGRLLLRREGYPIDYKEVIDACAAHNVIIEINANPYRLDMDWRWIQYALEKNVMFSINPDAHETETIEQMYYGVCVARKGGLPKASNFNCLSGEAVGKYFTERKTLIKN